MYTKACCCSASTLYSTKRNACIPDNGRVEEDRRVPDIERYVRVREQRGRREERRLRVNDVALPAMILEARVAELGDLHVQLLQASENCAAGETGRPVRRQPI